MTKPPKIPRLVVAIQVVGEFNPDDYITEEQAAAMLGHARNALSIVRNRGHGPKFMIMGKRTPLYRIGDVIDYARRRARISLRDAKGGK